MPAPGRNDGLDAPLRQPCAEGVAVIGPVRDQAGQGRVRPGFHQGLGLSAVVALAARHAQVQGTAASIRQNVDRGAEAAPATAQRGLRLLVLGRARRTHVRAHDRDVQQDGGPIRISLQGVSRRGQTPRLHQAA